MSRWDLALGFGLVATLTIYFGWWLTLGHRVPFGSPGGFLSSMGVAVVAVAVHELIHYVLMPGTGKEVGLWPSRLIAYVYRPGELARTPHTLLGLLAPFLVLSVLPVAFGRLLVNDWLVWVSIWNALASSFDLYSAWALIARKPA